MSIITTQLIPDEEACGIQRILRDGLAWLPPCPYRDTLETVLMSGKYLRGRLLLRLFTAGKIPEPDSHAHWLLAGGIEFIHAASLLHDDIVDGDAIRREAASFWKQHGIPPALLSGDWLLLQAVQTITPLLEPATTTRVLQVLQDMAATELDAAHRPIHPDADFARYLEHARKKTGGLFGLAAVLATPDIPVLEEAAQQLGIAYQLNDDHQDSPDIQTPLGDIAKQHIQKAGRIVAEQAPEWDPIWTDYVQTIFCPALQTSGNTP